MSKRLAKVLALLALLAMLIATYYVAKTGDVVGWLLLVVATVLVSSEIYNRYPR